MAGLDPNRNTRYEYTNAALSKPAPEDADPKWMELNNTLKNLMEKLINHESMRENAQQPYMTPAASKNQVYFVWDFVGRTLAMMDAVPPQLQASPQWSPAVEKMWKGEIVGRSTVVAGLISGDTSGDPKLSMLIRSMNPSQSGSQPEFGVEIKQLANRLQEIRA
ncbi:hypothetical protein J7T55_009400 [Diaporthe amygdali]|uniref:uncharacterized protein n=1 Tax=Phomopsis amygdali TaxID=1214568 RepID=UPI0022FEE42C|nr:uncharacterized protein J7T55_009400 [Diaporthe amygdali]KAJ0107435.1 hypothetical protein J7T55_009400 [Diaporthe amygdali]